MWARLSKWLLFGVLFALIPIGIRWLFVKTSGQSAGLEELVNRGELCLIPIGITSSALGDAALFERKYQTARVWDLALCGGNLLAAASYYGYVSSRDGSDPVDETFVLRASAVMFLMAACASGVCFGVSERERKRAERERKRLERERDKRESV
jgi:hypothetical protein